ncbi:MAG TPA: hypothetical protein VFF27_10975 [Bacteroidia bacterium]|nr:hypothetical protein [Bacteroidia bacterium]
MSSKDNLFSLIKSLTQGEKAFFVKSLPAKKADSTDYLTLFYAIDKFDEYNEDKLKVKLKNHAFVKHLPVVKNYLFNLILKQLRSYYNESSVKSGLIDLMQNADVLIKKALYRESYRVLVKAEKIAERYDFHVLALDIYDRLLRLNYDLLADNETTNYSLEIYNKQRVVFAKVSELAELKYLRNVYNSIFHSTEPDEIKQQRKQELLKHPLLQPNHQFLSYKAGVYYYHLRGRVLMNGNSDQKKQEAYETFVKLVKHMENDEEMLKVSLINYTMALNNLIYVSHQLEKYEESLDLIDKLNNIHTDNNYLAYRIKEKVIVNKLAYYLFTRKHKEGVVYIEKIEKELIENETLFNNSFFIAALDSFTMLYFLVGEYSKSLKWVNFILGYKNIMRLDVQCFAKVLNLMIHYELKNYDHLEYILKSTENFLTKNNSFDSYHKLIVQFFKTILQETNSQEIKKKFKELSKALAAIENTEAEKVMFKLFNFREWAEKKEKSLH